MADSEPVTMQITINEEVVRALANGGYYNAGNRDEDFKAHAACAFGIYDHPKRDRVFAHAWEYGHSSGYGEILSHYGEAVDLIK